jgi:anthraniloyl-CoA monooxygenase
MRVIVLGGGPGGLYAALLFKRRHPDASVTVLERNRPDDTFGWGVVLSDQTVDNLRAADEPSGRQLADALHRWDDIAIHVRGRTFRSTGHGFAGIGRQRLLTELQQRARALGVVLRFEAEVPDATALAADADLVIAADGLNSRTRDALAATYRPDVELRDCRYVWLGTARQFEAFTFAFEETPAGWVQAHAYRFDEATSTFIVEMPQATWQALGLEAADTDDALRWCERTFAAHLGGERLRSNAQHLRGSAQWIRFPRVTCGAWVHWHAAGDRRVPIVLLGDAAHTAHFSIGSGTKLALEDAIALDLALAAPGALGDGLADALARWQADRALEVLKLQNAARNSTEWFEHVARYASLPPEQFAYSLLTRSQRISHENLRLRDPAYIASFERWFADRAAAAVAATGGRGAAGEDTPAAAPAPPAAAPPPLFTPFRARGVTLRNRIVVSPMAQYSATPDGLPTDWHLVHLGARATGGAGLVMAEMTCVAPDARITPACPGLWDDAQEAAWARIVRFVHDHSAARIGLQLGHAGAKGATRRMWEGIDEPLASGGWPLLAASAVRYLPDRSVEARAMTRDDMGRVRDQFVQATHRAARAEFDWLELHAAHGYLLSGFLSPLTNRRTDGYGGSPERRLAFPLEVFRAMRDAWPADRPMSVRLSAHDWAEGGNTPDDAVAIARAFAEAGADVIDVSAGQVVKHERPVFGRLWQTPFADRIRQEAGVATIAVGAITDADQANGILASGRADLVAVGRPHLANPAWTLLEAARLDYAGADWPVQYRPGQVQLERLRARERAAAPAAAPARPGELT